MFLKLTPEYPVNLNVFKASHRQTDKHTNRQTHKQTDRQTDKQTNRRNKVLRTPHCGGEDINKSTHPVVATC